MPLVFSGLTIPPAQSLNGAGRGAAQRQLSGAGQRSVVPLVYGRDRLGGLVLNVLPAASGSNTLLVQVLWCFACDGLEDVRLNDLALPAGASVTHYLGTQTTTDAALVSAMAAQSITYSSTLNGYAYSVFSLPIREFDGQLNFAATIRGRKVYDPRKDSTAGGSGSHRLATPSTWEWSDNPALALADLLRDTTYGAGRTVNSGSVTTTANHCDALIGSPSEKRRIVGVSFTSPTELAQAADALRAYAGCFLLPGASGITLLPDQDGAAVATYSHASGEIASIDPLVLRDLSSVPTVVEVIYTDTSKLPWRDGSVSVSLAGAGSTRPYRLQQVRLPGVHRYSQALREATERLNKLTLGDMATVVEVFDIGIRHEIGDIVSITHPVGITAKPFRIANAPELVGPGRWRLPLVEHDAAMYSTTVATAPTAPDTSLINPAGPPPDVAVGAGGVTVSVVPGSVRVQIPSKPVVDIEALEIRRGANWASGVRLEDGAAGSTSIDGTVYDWAWPSVGSYTLWLRWRDRDGNLSVNAVSRSVTVTAADLSIGAEEFGGAVGGDNLLANTEFEARTVNAPTGYAIYNNDGSGATWIDAAGITGKAAAVQAGATPGRTFGIWAGIETANGIEGGWAASATYVVSFYARKVNGAGLTDMRLGWNVGPTGTALLNPNLTTGWQRYAYRITWGGSVEGNGRLYITANGTIAAGDQIHIDRLMVQRGDVLVDWMASRRDSATDATAKAAAAQAAAEAYAASMVIDMTRFAAGIRPPRVVSSLPVSPFTGYATGDTVVLTTDGKLYRFTGSAFTRAVDAADITVNQITAGQIAAGAIGVDQLAAGAVRAQHVLITTKGLNPDPSFSAGSARWSGFVQRLAATNGSVPASCPADFAAQFNARDNMWSYEDLAVVPGERYRASILVNRTGTTHPAGWVSYALDSAGVNLAVYRNGSTSASGWQRVSTEFEVPANCARMRFGPWINNSNATIGTAWFADFQLEKMADASLIVDGAVTAAKINIKVANQDGRIEIETNRIRVYDSSNNERVRLGQL